MGLKRGALYDRSRWAERRKFHIVNAGPENGAQDVSSTCDNGVVGERGVTRILRLPRPVDENAGT